MFRKPRRRIIYDSSVQSILEQALEKHERLYEVMRFFEWLLERSPDNGHAERLPPPNEDIWLIKSQDLPIANVPEVILLYTFDDQTVTFINIRVI